MVARVARLVAGLSAAVLIVLAVTYYLTHEPAPEIRIRWRDGLTAERQAVLERRFRVVNRKPFEDRYSYDLLDTSRQNVEALVNERDIQDTDRVDREGFTIPPDIPYGDSWMWVAYRLPLLREPNVVPAILIGAIALLAISTLIVARARPRARAAGGPAASS